MGEDVIFDDDCRVSYKVDFCVGDEPKDSCSTYNKCAFIKRVVLCLPKDDNVMTQIERDYYCDYVFDFDNNLINKIYFEMKRNEMAGIALMKRLRHVPLWCRRPL